jgi:MFS family permease
MLRDLDVGDLHHSVLNLAQSKVAPLGAWCVSHAETPSSHLDITGAKRIGKIDPGIAKSDARCGHDLVHDEGMSALTPIVPVLLGTAFSQAALGLMSTLIPLLLLRAGASSEMIGLVASAYFVGFLAGSLTSARLVQRFGHIRAYAALAACAVMTAQVLEFTEHPLALAITRILVGYASSGLFLIAESWLNDRADSRTRGRFMGAYMVTTWGAAALGPLLLRVTPPDGALFAAVGLCFAAAILPMALTHQDNPVLGQDRRLGLAALLAISPVGVACCLAAGLLNSAFYALMPAYLGRLGFDAQAISTFVSVITVAALLSQYPLGLLADRIERRRLAVMVLGLAFTAALVLVLSGTAWFAILVAGCMLAGSTSPLYGLGAGQMNDRLERSDYVAAAGGLLFTWSVGAAFGPAVAGGLMGLLGPRGLFVYLCLASALVAAFVILRLFARADVPLDRQSGFRPGGTTPQRLVAPQPERVL